MAKQATELRYAVRFRIIFKYFGQLCLVLAVLTLVPFVVAASIGDWPVGLRFFCKGMAAIPTSCVKSIPP